MRYKCLFNTSETKRRFLNLPKTIYNSHKNPNYKTEKAILTNTHILSSEMEVFPFVVFDTMTGDTMCRCLLTYYPNDTTAYVGFFEAKHNIPAAKLLFTLVEEKAKSDNKTRLVGPIDASIYINYRFKTKGFHKTYTGEPNNPPYYADMWEQCGFYEYVKYVSNQLRKVTPSDIDPRLQRIYDRYMNKGYEIKQPTSETFIQCLVDIYEVMMDSYSKFVGFKRISKEPFLELYKPLKQVLNFDMVHLLYKNDKLHAFSVAIPNYEELLNSPLSLLKILQIKKIKANPKEYILLYVGADTTPGAGSALLHHVCNKLCENQCTAITALIKEGNLTGKVYPDTYVNQFEYVLLEKSLEKKQEQ